RLSLFFLRSPPPPSSPLFPYTTLFRSESACGDASIKTGFVDELAYQVFNIPVVLRCCIAQCKDEINQGAALVDYVALVVFDEFINRKSTRLNSSHVKISYAVFCLKKKN